MGSRQQAVTVRRARKCTSHAQLRSPARVPMSLTATDLAGIVAHGLKSESRSKHRQKKLGFWLLRNIPEL